MTTSIKLTLAALLFFTAVATATPEGTTPRAGFRRQMKADTLPATLPRAREAKAIYASVRVSGEVGVDAE